MLYKKNVGTTERVIRGLAGLGMIVCGFQLFGEAPLAWVAAASGVFTIATGVVGFCPACAVAGRSARGEAKGTG
jgi:hypothetical protein